MSADRNERQKLLAGLIESEWKKILKPVLLKRIGLMLDEVAAQQSKAVSQDRAPETSRRQEAVKYMLAAGFKWKDGKWELLP